MTKRGVGRPRTRVEVEATVVFDLRAMMRSGRVVPGARTVRTIEWGPEGEPPAAVLQFTADMGQDGGCLIMRHPGGEPYAVEVVSVPQRFGGRRWWLVCPVYDVRSAVLYLPRGATGFASRQAHGLGYRSQRLDGQGRAAARGARIRAALGGDCDPAAPFPAKPKRMRWSTYEQQRERAGTGEGDLSGPARAGTREREASTYPIHIRRPRLPFPAPMGHRLVAKGTDRERERSGAVRPGLNKKVLVFVDDCGTAGSGDLYLGAVFVLARDAGRLDKRFSDLLEPSAAEIHAVDMTDGYLQGLLGRFWREAAGGRVTLLNGKVAARGGTASRLLQLADVVAYARKWIASAETNAAGLRERYGIRIP